MNYKKYINLTFILLLTSTISAHQEDIPNPDNIVFLIEQVPNVDPVVRANPLIKLGMNLDKLELLVTKAEVFYLKTKYSEPEKSKEDLQDRKSLVESLNKYKEKFFNFLFDKKLVSNFEKRKIEFIYLPVLNEVIRRLQDDTEQLYGKNIWEPSTISRIAKPILWSTLLTVSSIGAAKLLEKKKVISTETYNKAKWAGLATGLAVAGGGVAYNFNDRIQKRLRKSKNKKKNRVVA